MFHTNIALHGTCEPAAELLPTVNENGDVEPDLLHAIISHNNYASFDSRVRLHRLCIEHLKEIPGMKIWVIEIVVGDRPFVVTSSDNPQHIQVRTSDMIWHKESSINVAVRHITHRHPNWKYVAWIDGDIQFMNKHVAHETIHELQSYAVVQMFQSVVNHGPNGEVLDTHQSFAFQYAKQKFKYTNQKEYEKWHPGFAWAMTRKAFNGIGGLIDFAVLGSADYHMARAFVGAGIVSHEATHLGSGFRRRLQYWHDRAVREINHNLGYVNGTILHGFHGRFQNRQYNSRWELLYECDYDPDRHIKHDEQGLVCWDEPNPRLRNLVRGYFESRNEDSIDL
jgi:hypothetical protein